MQEGSTLHIGDGPFAVESFSQSTCNRASFRVVAEPLQVGCAVLLAECLVAFRTWSKRFGLRLGGIAALFKAV